MANLKKLSDSELSELLNCLCELQNRIADYSHIEKYIDNTFKASLDNQIQSAYKEENERNGIAEQVMELEDIQQRLEKLVIKQIEQNL